MKILKTISILAGIVAIVGVAVFSNVGGQVELQATDKVNFNGKEITFNYTDNNIGETLIIKSTTSTYGGWDRADMHFNVFNKGSNDNVAITFTGDAEVQSIKEYTPDVPYNITVSDYGFKETNCKSKWQPSLSEMSEDIWECGEITLHCDRIDEDDNCEEDEGYLGNHEEVRYKDEWQEIGNTVAIDSGETKFYKARITFEPKTKGEFDIIIAGQTEYGILDPWYNSNWTYKRKMTIEAGDTSGGFTGGVATTTDGAFVVLASTTQTWLKDTGGGGKIEQAMGYDIIFVDDDDATLLAYEYESYSSSTGSLVAWIEAPNVSSTSDEFIYVYYGNSAATDNSTPGDTWTGDLSPVGVWHLSETPTSHPNALDSTNNDNDGTFNGTMTASDQVAGQIDGSLDFDGGDDNLDMGSPSLLDNATDATWIIWAKPDNTTETVDGALIASTLTSDPIRYLIWFDAGNDKWQAVVDDNESDRIIVQNNGNVQPSGNWEQIVVVLDSTDDSLSIRVNNVAAGTNSNASFGSILAGADDLWIGSEAVNARDFEGQISEVRIYNTALTQADITTIYNMEFANSTFLTWGAEEIEASDVDPTIIDINGGVIDLNSGTLNIN